ncbi:CPA1 family monovalent cation:H+ antiporter [Saccharothrix tamanrassetensis]|uniref:CPA1 family monovalent cation:H+ antiporter n=1 Tax=Saccharothrix tamanrassetensis TaxID=1051531 RepID=A0A841CAU6_9PSEU|nr:Na+/H+ antiporter [Saccharothrix tamanrassetensis]MBB5954519.1 CPA1 family monovalent cation:H+ antiporter [Saccharothrix tamanrassetensis]
MHGPELLLLLVGALLVTAVAKRLFAPAPLVLVATGLAVSFIPGLPEFALEPELILVLVLPPLLYSAALDSSYHNIRANLRPIGLLAVGLVIATTVGVGWVAHLVLPQLSIPAALVLGAVVAPPDAVAAVAIGRRLNLPRRTMTLLTGESLINDATALTVYKVAIAATLGATATWVDGTRTFIIGAGGGVLVGLAIGFAVRWLRDRLDDGVMESSLGMLVPFGAYLFAEELGSSGVLAVVVAGLYIGHHAPRSSYYTRLQDTAVWRSVDVLLEAFVFALIGLQLKNIVLDVDITADLVRAAAAVLAATIAVRFLWMYPAAYIPRFLSKRIRQKEPAPGWRGITVLSWAGMRGVVSLAAASALPLELPGRDVIVFCAFVVTVGTLLLQGLSLPWVIRRLGVKGDEERADALAEAQVQHAAAQAAVNRLDEMTENDDHTPGHVVDRLRIMAEHRGNAAWERLGRQEDESPAASYRRLRRTMLEAERQVFVEARDNGQIDDEVLFRVLRELDLEEAAISRE